MESTIMKNLSEGKFVLIAEIGVNYYDIASSRGISNMDAAKLMIKEVSDVQSRNTCGKGITVLLGYYRGTYKIPV